MSKRGFTIDSKLDHEAVDEAYGAKSDLNLTAYAHNVAYVCDVSRDSEHLYQEIPFRCNERPFDSNKDMVMVQNVAYTVANREVIYVDNVAYARATSQQHKI